MTAPYPLLEGDEPCIQAADPDVFFAEDVRAAVDLCSVCPQRRPCLAYALTHDVRGVWGATSEPTRQEIRRKHGIRAVPMAPFRPPTAQLEGPDQ